MYTITKQELRRLLLKCCRHCISSDIIMINISFDSANCIKLQIPKEQQPNFKIPTPNKTIMELNEFNKYISDYSFGNLKLSSYITSSSFEKQNDLYNVKVLSLYIDCNYQIAG